MHKDSRAHIVPWRPSHLFQILEGYLYRNRPHPLNSRRTPPMNAMETIQKLADSASKAIWGEHEEPVSGKMGNVATGEPYDAGNIGKLTENKVTSHPVC